MEINDIYKVVENIPHMTRDQGVKMYDLIIKNRFSRILELGFHQGVSTCYMAGALHKLEKGKITTIDLTHTRNLDPSIDSLLMKLGLSSHVDVHYEPTSYNWRLMRLIEENNLEKFDFCYIDGAHNWLTDGFAFFLVDILLKPGGLILFDDLDWSYANSPSLKDNKDVLKMPNDERTIPQVRQIFELLVRKHNGYCQFKEQDGWGYAWKRNKSLIHKLLKK